MQFFARDGECGRLLGFRLGEQRSLYFISLTWTDGKNLLFRVNAVSDILWVVQVLKYTLGKGDAVLFHENIRGCIGGNIEHLELNVCKIDIYEAKND